LLPSSVMATGDLPVAIFGDPTRQGLAKFESESNAKTEKLDVIFPVLHGTYGEDGTIQGLLEMADVPYVGCGVLGSACGMDKVVMKRLFREAGLPIVEFVHFLRTQWEADPLRVEAGVIAEIGFPCFVKPANLGSSVGISKATDAVSLNKAIALAARFDRKIVIERGVNAREIEVSILGNDEPRASLPGEIVPESADFYDYAAKYVSADGARLVIPAQLSDELTAQIQKLGVQAFQAVDGAGLSRVDFFLEKETGALFLNEINTLPGFTSISMYPKMWEASGLSYSDLLDELIELALERHREKSRNVTSYE
jgi:D-alanine-D-alanine ligase